MIRNNCESEDYPRYDPIHSFNFKPYLERLNGITIYYAPHYNHNIIKDNSFKVTLNFETPNGLYMRDMELTTHEAQNADLCLHLCPYVCRYLNGKFNTTKFKPMFFPIEIYKPIAVSERTIDVFYTGNFGVLKSLPVGNIIHNTLVRVLTYNRLNQLIRSIRLRSKDGYYAKLELLNKVKIAITHNIIVNCKNVPGYNIFKEDVTCKTFLPWHTDGGEYLPQLKSRVFEAGLMGCVVLIYKDKYGVVENYFKEGEDFLYYTSQLDLDQKVDLILANYQDYRYLGENIRRKIINNYTTEHLVDLILKYKSELNN